MGCRVEDDDDGSGAFLLDAPEYSDEEWEERPKCNWAYGPLRLADRTIPGFACAGEPRWRFMTTYSNASKTDTMYCHYHGIFFHASVRNWAMIDHNTKADTMVIDMTTEEVCICTSGDECAAMLEYRKRNRERAAKVKRSSDALEFWN
jgi:hypothetical protein